MTFGVVSWLLSAATSSCRLVTRKTWFASAAAPPVVPGEDDAQPSPGAKVSRPRSTADAGVPPQSTIEDDAQASQVKARMAFASCYRVLATSTRRGESMSTENHKVV